jgi:glycosyltransferase involved in cell wall biosynthesis
MELSEKRILFVATQFPPNDSIGTQRIVKFIKYLELKGWEIHVLTLEEKYYRNSSNIYRLYLPDDIHVYRRKKIEIFQAWNGIKKLFSRVSKGLEKANGGPPENTTSQNENGRKGFTLLFELKELVSNLLQYPDQENGFFFSVLFATYRLIKKHRIPYLFISSPPHSPVIPVTLLKRFISFSYIVDFRDPWARSQWQQESMHLYQKIEKKLDLFFEHQTLKAADVAIFNTEQLRKDFAEYYVDTPIPKKFHFISNGFDPELKVQHSANGSYSKGKGNRITLLHAGTLYKKRNPEVIFEGLLKFRESHPTEAKAIELNFIGALSEDLLYLRQYIIDHKLTENVKFHSKLSYDEILEEMKAADWMLLLQPGTTFQIPAKFFDYLLVNKPIWGVLERNSVGEKAIKELNIGYVSDCASFESIVEFFKVISTEKRHFTPDQVQLQRYSLPFLTTQLERIILNHGRAQHSIKKDIV